MTYFLWSFETDDVFSVVIQNLVMICQRWLKQISCRVGQSSSKTDFVMRIGIFKGNLLPGDDPIGSKQPILQVFDFFLLLISLLPLFGKGSNQVPI